VPTAEHRPPSGALPAAERINQLNPVPPTAGGTHLAKGNEALMEPTPSILLAAEDAATRAFLANNLIADGFRVLTAEDRTAALTTLDSEQPDLVICDVNGETLGLLDAVRQHSGVASRIDPDVPLIVLTGRAGELARVRYLDRGSDDVVSKPCSYAELRARIRAVLRRTHRHNAHQVTRVGALRIDHAGRDVRLGDTPIALSGMEYALLAHLAADPSRVFTKHELLRDVWGFRSPGRTRTLDSHACKLRHKLSDPGDGRFIENIWGVGYRLIAPSQQRKDESAA
jgi:DNA-binding response OmpR family regulator